MEDAGYIAEFQGSRQGLSKVYLMDPSIAREGLRFREHGIGPVIEVREEKPKVYWAPYQPKGRVISLRHFRKDVWQPLERQVRAINAVMGAS